MASLLWRSMVGYVILESIKRFFNEMRFWSKKVTDIIAKFSISYEKRLQDHVNIEASRYLNVNNITRRLKRKKPFELVIR
jgi:uncharacterized protein YeeX (DUF496 family)